MFYVHYTEGSIVGMEFHAAFPLRCVQGWYVKIFAAILKYFHKEKWNVMCHFPLPCHSQGARYSRASMEILQTSQGCSARGNLPGLTCPPRSALLNTDVTQMLSCHKILLNLMLFKGASFISLVHGLLKFHLRIDRNCKRQMLVLLVLSC